MHLSLAIPLLALTRAVGASFPNSVDFHRTSACDDRMSSSLATTGKGFPDCVVYDTQTVFGNQSFPENNGTFSPFIEIPEHDDSDSCYLIIRSPSVTANKCDGELLYQFDNSTCASVDLGNKTFAAQYCCGEDECKGAGVKDTTESGGVSLSLQPTLLALMPMTAFFLASYTL
ncbi:hypothetical protein F4808DRAFT_461998 [Astrocystis sublimbata]|nr:hypothetical protein F4808DRAFT_461998 [Astrocystis sublimbata]